MSLEKLQRCHRCSSIVEFVYNDWSRNLPCTPRQSAITTDTHATMFIYYCVACQLEGSNFLSERRGCEWKAVPQLSWMEVNARDYWVCPGCARLVNRDVNREHRGMPVIGIQPISRQPTDLDRVSDDAWWKVAFTTLRLSSRIHYANWYANSDAFGYTNWTPT